MSKLQGEPRKAGCLGGFFPSLSKSLKATFVFLLEKGCKHPLPVKVFWLLESQIREVYT